MFLKKREIETTNENIKDMAEDNLKHESPTNAIDWHYFFGGGAIPHQHHYYKSDINGLRVEKHTFNGRVEYSIGNMDNAKIKFKTEKELLDAITPKL